MKPYFAVEAKSRLIDSWTTLVAMINKEALRLRYLRCLCNALYHLSKFIQVVRSIGVVTIVTWLRSKSETVSYPCGYHAVQIFSLITSIFYSLVCSPWHSERFTNLLIRKMMNTRGRIVQENTLGRENLEKGKDFRASSVKISSVLAYATCSAWSFGPSRRNACHMVCNYDTISHSCGYRTIHILSVVVSTFIRPMQPQRGKKLLYSLLLELLFVNLKKGHWPLHIARVD